ncbi:MAG: OmpH family outer membrane protein [Opitutales bacterium]
MKSLRNTLLALFAAGAAVTAFGQATPVMVTVDMQELYQKYEKASEARERFQSSVTNAQEEVQTMQQEMQELQEELQTLNEQLQSDALADAAREEMTQQLQEGMQNLRTKQQEIMQFRQQTQQFLQERSQSILQLHYREIQDVVSQIAEDLGADLVLNTGGQMVVYADESFDITEQVLERLNVAAEEE